MYIQDFYYLQCQHLLVLSINSPARHSALARAFNHDGYNHGKYYCRVSGRSGAFSLLLASTCRLLPCHPLHTEPVPFFGCQTLVNFSRNAVNFALYGILLSTKSAASLDGVFLF